MATDMSNRCAPMLGRVAAPAPARGPSGDDRADAALIDIGRHLQRSGYRFTTATPDTHRLVNARPGNAEARDLHGVFGWSRPFHPTLLAGDLRDALERADALEQLGDGLLRSRIRFSTVADLLLLHSAYPTTATDAVFLGPDTYRFIDLLRRSLGCAPSLLEIGTGSGAAVLSLADRFARLTATDVNPVAVRYAQVNAVLAGCARLDIHCADMAQGVGGEYSAIIINPPYLIDPHGPLYRDGGALGIELAMRMLDAALPLLARGGRLVLYTGAPIVAGRDLLEDALRPILDASELDARYEVLEVDVFGSSLAAAAYAGMDRIAVVAATVDRRRAIERGAPAPSIHETIAIRRQP
jgi:release factor glutamine methyltransferase